jgi:hypothetical protein
LEFVIAPISVCQCRTDTRNPIGSGGLLFNVCFVEARPDVTLIGLTRKQNQNSVPKLEPYPLCLELATGVFEISAHPSKIVYVSIPQHPRISKLTGFWVDHGIGK